MDLSKLPRMSQTPPPPPPTEPTGSDTPMGGTAAPSAARCPYCGSALAPGANFCSTCGNSLSRQPDRAPSYGAEAWISLGIGLILLLLYPRLLQYLLGSNFTWTFTDEQGQPLAYTRSVFFWSDLGVTLFSLALIVEGIALFVGRSLILYIAAVVVTAVSVLVNLYIVVALGGQLGGLPVASALGIVFGLYMLFLQWRAVQSMRRGA